MDLWCLGAMHSSGRNMRLEARRMLALGEGIIPTMRHAHKKLLAETGVLGSQNSARKTARRFWKTTQGSVNR